MYGRFHREDGQSLANQSLDAHYDLRLGKDQPTVVPGDFCAVLVPSLCNSHVGHSGLNLSLGKICDCDSPVVISDPSSHASGMVQQEL